MGLRERLGDVTGETWAPAVAAISRLRAARMFHAHGLTFAGYSAFVEGPFEELGRALTGRVLARFSPALWQDFEHLDVLGLALRFRRGLGADLDEHPEPGDQDLLTATIRSPFTMLASPLFTDASDYAGNTYWAVSPFSLLGEGRALLRLVPVARAPYQPLPRNDRLFAALDSGHTIWWLQARRTLHLRWHNVVRIQLDHETDLDQDTLAFDPFRGALQPVGVVQWIRRAVYAASQHARPR
jgi:hypothetical protein